MPLVTARPESSRVRGLTATPARRQPRQTPRERPPPYTLRPVSFANAIATMTEQTKLFSLHGLINLRIVGVSSDATVLSFQLRRSEIPDDGRIAEVTWMAGEDRDTPADAHPVVVSTDAGDPQSHIRRTGAVGWELYGEGHRFNAVAQMALVERGSTLLHGAGLTFDGHGVVLWGRGGIGKSSLSFGAFHDARLQLLSDDILITDPSGSVHSFPMPHAIYAYHHPLLPPEAQARFRGSKRQSALLGPLYENPITRPIGRAVKRRLVLTGGSLGQQAARVRPHFVQVHSDELFEPHQLRDSAKVDLAIHLVREGAEVSITELSLEQARSFALAATYRELELEDLLSAYALTGSLDLAEHWANAISAATAFLSAGPTVLQVQIPRSKEPGAVQRLLLDLLTERLAS